MSAKAGTESGENMAALLAAGGDHAHLNVPTSFPKAGISLFENDKPFGEKEGWSIAKGFVDDDFPWRLDLVLEN
jgi:hypothetical protein